MTNLSQKPLNGGHNNELDGRLFVRGDPEFYQSSQFVERGFCADCGSPMFFRPTNEDFVSILSGTLDGSGIVLTHVFKFF
jgi:hypothetical protein